MAALVQTYPQQSGTVTMLQTRPASASQAQATQQYAAPQPHRNSFYGTPSGMGGPAVYRANAAPIAPYAFTATPSLNPSVQQWQLAPMNSRSSSSPTVPTMQNFDHGHASGRLRYSAVASASTPNLEGSSGGYAGSSRDDSTLPGNRRAATTPRPLSAYMTGTASQVSPAQAAPVRVSPERYRRPAVRAATDTTSSAQQQPQQQQQQVHPQMSAAVPSSGVASAGLLINSRGIPEQKVNNAGRNKTQLANRPNSFYGVMPGAAVDDIQLYRHHEDVKRVRRRSMPALDSADYPNFLTPHAFKQPEDSPRPGQQLTLLKAADKDQKSASARIAAANGSADGTMHRRNGSSESAVSSRSSSNSRPSSAANRNANVPAPTSNPASLSQAPDQKASNLDSPRLVNVPPRTSSSDAASRVANPSPLSKPVTMDPDADADAAKASGAAKNAAISSASNAPAASLTANSSLESPAVRQLSAINQKGTKLKSKTSRLRRAFSFGSAAEFRKAGGPDDDSASASTAGPAKLHKDPTAEEIYNAEQARIAQKQEEGGIGNSIYAGARIFAGSTDNLSISSTASSASIMIRKMGRGMKKGTRSLVGLFRPKSVIGVPAADIQVPEASQAAVSMITVEAERERVNVNAEAHSRNGGGTGFPRLERNSIDASKAPSTVSDRERVGSSDTENSNQRKSILGGEKERAEVLAAVRKGILKNTSGSTSPSRGPGEGRNQASELPSVPAISDSPASSAPSTPNDDAQGHKRTGSVTIGHEDYFVTALRLKQESKSSPNTPQGTLKRNATFSPRIVFYDTWPSQEYDRRGDIATCNRLTPMLAQQIKEELNSFKMEMEVHENSKIYTHFF